MVATFAGKFVQCNHPPFIILSNGNNCIVHSCYAHTIPSTVNFSFKVPSLQ